MYRTVFDTRPWYRNDFKYVLVHSSGFRPISGNVFLKPRPVILLSRSRCRYVRIPTYRYESRRRKDAYLRCFSGDSGAICKFNKIKSARNEPLLHFSPSKMTTVDPQRTAQIREVLAQTLSPDAATRRTVSFIVRNISIDSISSSH